MWTSKFKQSIFLFCAMGCLGITTEIFFTAFTGLYSGTMDIQMKGFSYIWMFPIYGLSGIAFPPALKLMHRWNILFRMCAYATGILAVEFATGWLLELITGQCPWEYREGWHLFGYIRFDYFPFWAAFGLMVETALKFLMRMPFESSV